MTEILTRRQALLLAFVVCVALGLLGIGLFAIGDRQQLWQQPFTITMKLPNAGGLDIGTRVRIQGVQAGQVIGIEQPLQRGGDLLVSLRLDARSRSLLGSDARGEVKTEGLLGGKVVDLVPGSPGSESLAENATIPGHIENLADDLKKLASDSQGTLSDLRTLAGNLKQLSERGEKAVLEIEGLTSDLREGKGPLGTQVLGTIKQMRESSQSVKNGFDALKHVPMIGKHIDPYTKMLIRPGMDKVVGVFTETDLFHEGRSVFHPEGVAKLRDWASRHLPNTKLAGSEIVIVSYTDPSSPDSSASDILTLEQAEAVRTYLIDHHEAQKLSFFSRRSVQAIGMGNRTAPGTPTSPPPPIRRIEIILFAPAGTLS